MSTGRRDTAAMVAIVVALGALTIAVGERIGVNQGQGWDGMGYTQWGQAWWQHIVVEGTTQYSSQRVLPSAIVHYGLRLFGLATTAPHVITAFQVLNLAALALAAALWGRLGAVMAWRRASRWVGFVALFGCFANARHALYYPTLTDPTAFALGMAMVYAYLARRPIALWLAAAAASVTWAALTPVALVLLVLPRPAVEIPELAERWRPALRWGAVAVGVAAGGAFALIGLHYHAHPLAGVNGFTRWVRGEWLWLTVPLLIATVGVGSWAIVGQPRLWNLRAYVRQLSRGRFVVALGAAIALEVVRAWWIARAGTRGPGMVTALFLDEHTQAALLGPLWGPVFQVVYFGPIMLVAVLRWRRIAALAAAWGPGAALALAMALAFAASSQSRQWVHLVPLVVALAIAATDDVWTARRALAFVALALPWSKLWLVIGYDVHVAHREFPNQRYYMHHGPWASDTTYALHLVVCAMSAAVIYLLLRPASANALTGSTPS